MNINEVDLITITVDLDSILLHLTHSSSPYDQSYTLIHSRTASEWCYTLTHSSRTSDWCYTLTHSSSASDQSYTLTHSRSASTSATPSTEMITETTPVIWNFALVNLNTYAMKENIMYAFYKCSFFRKNNVSVVIS